MSTFAKPDGVIEFGMSGCCCPPGAMRAGQHTNSSTSWYRVNDGPWRRQILTSGSMRTLAMAAETVAEFEDAANQ